MPEFSVIVPVYKVEKYLRRCVDSILIQKDADFEVILVDDGSPDNCGAICDEYAAKDDRVTVIHQENSGASEARNTGIKKATGKYLLFIDADDRLNNDSCFKNVKRVLDNNRDLDVLCWGLKILNEDGQLVKVRKPSSVSKASDDKYSVLKNMIYKNEYISTSYCKAIKRNLIIENNLYFVRNLKSEDIEWVARIMVLCKNIGTFDEVYYNRITRKEDSLTSSIGRKNVLDILNQIENGVEFAKEHAENQDFLDLYYEYWAYQYAMLLGFCRRASKESDFTHIKNRLKKLSWLLEFDHVKKVRIVNKLYKILGLDTTMFILDVYYKVK